MTQHRFSSRSLWRPALSACGILWAGLMSVKDGQSAELSTLVQAMQLAQEATAASQASDLDVALDKLEAAVSLRPDLPWLLHRLAVVQVKAEQFDAARTTLERLAAMGLGLSASDLAAFSTHREKEAFADVIKQLSANLRSKGKGDLAFSLQGVTGLIEGIAWRESSGDFYFGDVNARVVWMRNKDNTLRRLTPEGDELLGVLGLIVDEARGALWAATSAVRAMRGFTSDQEGNSELVELDLASGAIRQIIAIPRREGTHSASALGDLALDDNGGIFATDRGEPIIWYLPPGATSLERFAESPEFIALRGIALMGGALIVADHLNGILRVDLGDGSVEWLEPPPDVTLVGLSGLIRAPDGALLALQGGVNPTRVLRIELDARASAVTSVTVLESGHLTMSAPSLGCIGTGGDLFFIGNAPWSRFEQTGGSPTAPRPVPVFRTKVSASGR
jgi:hypothetical protein